MCLEAVKGGKGFANANNSFSKSHPALFKAIPAPVDVEWTPAQTCLSQSPRFWRHCPTRPDRVKPSGVGETLGATCFPPVALDKQSEEDPAMDISIPAVIHKHAFVPEDTAP